MIDKTYQPSEVEGRIYRTWEEAGAFKAGRPERIQAAPYSIVIPPPNVTGSLHMGHALNNTLQDVLCRFERMRGKDVLWQPGTDHAGIATQMVVERQLRERQQPGRRGRHHHLAPVRHRRDLRHPVHLQPGQPRLGVLAAPLDHRRLRAPRPLGNLRPGQPVRSQQHDPRPFHHPGWRALRPGTPLQLSPVRIRHRQNPHAIGHSPLSRISAEH